LEEILKVNLVWFALTMIATGFGAGISVEEFLLKKFQNAPPPVSEHIDSIEKALLSNNGIWEWQWAGQNWLGSMHFYKDQNNALKAKVEVIKCIMAKGDKHYIEIFNPKKAPKVLITKLPGNVIIGEEKKSIMIKDLVVNQNFFESQELPDGNEIEGTRIFRTEISFIETEELSHVPAFAGKIKYKHAGSDEVGEGDIILVKYASGQLIPIKLETSVD